MQMYSDDSDGNKLILTILQRALPGREQVEGLTLQKAPTPVLSFP